MALAEPATAPADVASTKATADMQDSERDAVATALASALLWTMVRFPSWRAAC